MLGQYEKKGVITPSLKRQKETLGTPERLKVNMAKEHGAGESCNVLPELSNRIAGRWHSPHFGLVSSPHKGRWVPIV